MYNFSDLRILGMIKISIFKHYFVIISVFQPVKICFPTNPTLCKTRITNGNKIYEVLVTCIIIYKKVVSREIIKKQVRLISRENVLPLKKVLKKQWIS